MKMQKVLIVVKTYPTLSKKYDELVCTAGILEDGSWVRIYPLPFRKLEYENRYKKYQWMTLPLVKNKSDPRKEFFNDYSEIVTKNKMTIKAFEKEKAKLIEDSEILETWLAYQSRFPHLSKYFRLSSQYPHQIAVVNGRKTGSDINLYKLFLEQCFNLLRKDGQCGIVIPSGIYTDLGATGLRNLLFNETKITGLFCFENRKKIKVLIVVLSLWC